MINIICSLPSWASLCFILRHIRWVVFTTIIHMWFVHYGTASLSTPFVDTPIHYCTFFALEFNVHIRFAIHPAIFLIINWLRVIRCWHYFLVTFSCIRFIARFRLHNLCILFLLPARRPTVINGIYFLVLVHYYSMNLLFYTIIRLIKL